MSRFVIFLAATVLALAGHAETAPAPASKQSPQPQQPPAAAKPAARDGAGKPLNVRFVIQPPREAQLASQMSGRLDRFLFVDGASFRKGDKLAEFDCAERKAQLDKARAAQEKAEKTEIAQKQLRDLKAISDLDYDIARATLREAQADVAMASSQVSQCYIVAPYGGRVARRIANQHEHMTVGAPLMQIVESGVLKLELLVPSSWLRWLKKGSEFRIHVDELDADVKGRVTSLGAKVDAASQTIDIRAEIVGSTPGLLPGMSGTADFGAH